MCCSVLWLGPWHQRALAQGAAAQAVSVEVRDTAGLPSAMCFTSEQLSARIAHYGGRATPSRGARVVVDILGRDAVELRIFREDALLSRRRFEQLPAACADRRDAIALSIALALSDSAKSGVSATGAASAGPSAAASSNDAAATGAGPGKAGSDSSVAGASSSDAAPGDPARPDAAGNEPSSESAGRGDAEPPAAEPQPRAAPAPDEEADTAPVVLGTMPSSTSHSRSGESGSSLQLHLGGRFIAEALPMSAWAGALGIVLPLSKRLALDVSALASLQAESSFGVGRARAQLMGLELLGCGSLPFGAFALDVCAGATAAICEVSGRGYPVARPEATLLWAAGLARVMLRWPREEILSVRAVVQGHINVSRPELRVDGVNETLHPGWVGVTLGLELLLTLP